MPYCSQCGAEIGHVQYCPNCGALQEGPSVTPPYREPATRRTGGVTYDSTICLVICCCLSPIAALIYYLLTEHEERPSIYHSPPP